MPSFQLRRVLFVIVTLPFTVAAVSAQSRDSQAVTILQNSLKAMGGSAPSDSTATGTLTTVAGGQTSQGTIQVLTKGLGETSIQFAQPNETSTTVYSGGLASQIVGTTNTNLPLESAVTCQAAEFPLALLAALLNDPDTSFQYIGLETVSGQALYHIQAWDSFASQPAIQDLSSLSTRDIWINPSSGLPQRISFTRYAAQGEAGIRTDVFYMSYVNSSGVLYPAAIAESLNGTPWATITIQTVLLNTGLTDSQFPVQNSAQAGTQP
jgi:hypothetical protein